MKKNNFNNFIRHIHQGRVVSYLYTGPYAGMEGPYSLCSSGYSGKWLRGHGYLPDILFKFPDEVPESELQTRIVMLLK